MRTPAISRYLALLTSVSRRSFASTASLKFHSVALLVAVAAVAAPAQAAERFNLDMNNLRIKNAEGEKRYNLRAMLKQQHGAFDSERFELRTVRVVAKSRINNAQIRLSINDLDTAPVNVAGTKEKFGDNERSTFGRYELEPANPAATDGKWWLKAQGALRIDRVVLFLNDCGLGECIAQTQATTRKLSFNDTIYRLAKKDGTHTIRLRNELKNAYGVSLADAHLKSVEIISKTKEDQMGRAILILGDQVAQRVDLPAGPGAFKSNDPGSYGRTMIEPRFQTSGEGGRWVLELRKANIRVREILVTTIDRAYWRPGNQAASAAGTATPRALCTADNCPKGPAVTKSATGPRSCYASSDGRQIDRRNGAVVSWREGCADGSCQSRNETCFESRTCLCANGSGRCKDTGSCGAGGGCKYGFATKKMHCKSGIFDVN